jgi:hypothetical protein
MDCALFHKDNFRLRPKILSTRSDGGSICPCVADACKGTADSRDRNQFHDAITHNCLALEMALEL